MPTKLDLGRLKKGFKFKVSRETLDAAAKMHRSGQSYTFIPFAKEREIVNKDWSCESFHYPPLPPTYQVYSQIRRH